MLVVPDRAPARSQPAAHPLHARWCSYSTGHCAVQYSGEMRNGVRVETATRQEAMAAQDGRTEMRLGAAAGLLSLKSGRSPMHRGVSAVLLQGRALHQRMSIRFWMVHRNRRCAGVMDKKVAATTGPRPLMTSGRDMFIGTGNDWAARSGNEMSDGRRSIRHVANDSWQAGRSGQAGR